MNPELQELVRAMVHEHGPKQTAEYILEAHYGRLDTAGPINPRNMHLVRQYRNHVTADPFAMIAEAEE